MKTSYLKSFVFSAVVAATLASASLFAQDTITSVASPVASYIYAQAPGTDTTPVITSAASYVYEESPGTNVLALLSSDRTSYYYFGDTESPAVTGSALVNGTGLAISGVSSFSNTIFYVMATTNITVPESQWTIIATNLFDAYGYFSFTNKIDASQPLKVYSITVP